jgi:hypothetical protein
MMPAVDFQMLLGILQLVGVFGTGGVVAIVLQHLLGIRTLNIQRKGKAQEEILVEAREYLVRLYIPIAQISSALANQLKSSQEKPTEEKPTYDTWVTFYHFCLYRAYLSRLFRELRAGYILSDLDAETAVVNLQEAAHAQIRKAKFTPEEISHVQEKIIPETSLLEFRERLSWDCELSRILDKFKAWLGSKDESVVRAAENLAAFSRLLIYEANIIYEAWYRRKDRLPRDVICKVRKDVPTYRLGRWERIIRRLELPW